MTSEPAYYQIALDAHINMLLEQCNDKPRHWCVMYSQDTDAYKVCGGSISALFMIDHMRRRGITSFLRFTLENETTDAGSFWILRVDKQYCKKCMHLVDAVHTTQ
jgi:hypothetical protein